MGFILSFLKSPKVIMIILAAIIVGGASWYGINLIEENGRLEEKLSQTELQLENTRNTLEKEREQFERTLTNYNDVMSDYLNRLSESDQNTQSLRNTIDRLARDNQKLQQCFETEAPDELLDELFGEGTKE